MRIKTKMILICCISVLFSSAVCSVVVYSLVKNSSLNAAEAQGLKNALVEFSNIEERIGTLYAGKTNIIDEEVMKYILKEQNDEMLVCFSERSTEGEEIFNSTVFEQKDFEQLSYHPVEGIVTEVAQMKWEAKHFFVYCQTGHYGSFVFYRLEDVSYVWERMRLLGLGLVILTCVITMFVCFMLFVIINRVLYPLQKLNAGAKQIARGQYDERIAVMRKDEIGELSDNFNQMAEAVQHRTDQLKEAEWKRTLFMGDLTHELKTPMTAISGYARTLMTVKLSEEDKEQVKRVEVPAKTLFYNASEACSHSLAEDGIFLECREAGENFVVDADLFTEVLINLIDNARKASREGGRIILSASPGVIEVRDFGTGIPEEETKKILEPFYMIDKSRSRKSGGAGLGLAITAMILKKHDCELQIESRVGEGTRMILQFV